MLIISHKYYISTKSSDSTLLLSLLYDIREALYFKNVGFSAFSGFSRVKSGFISSIQIWPRLKI